MLAEPTPGLRVALNRSGQPEPGAGRLDEPERVGRPLLGYVGLERLGSDVRITQGDMVEVQRLLRRVLASQKRTDRTRLSRKGKRRDGTRRRMVNRRYKLPTLKGTGRGFIFLTNDGAQLAYDVARTIQVADAPQWPRGQRRPLP